MPELTMPRLSDTMEEGVLLEWLVEDGTVVEAGTPIADIETDKATMTLSAEEAGALHRLADTGESIPVGVRIGWIGDDLPTAGQADGLTPSNAVEVEAEPEPAASPATATAAAVAGRATRAASPVARRLAAELGVDLARVVGTGPGGRVGKKDVEAAARRDWPEDAADPPLASAEQEAPASQLIDLTRVQALIAERMAATQREVPAFAVEVDARMDAAAALKDGLLQTGEAPKVSYNDMIVKACATALKEHPKANSSFVSGQRVEHAEVNIGIAVATPGALIVPVLRAVDRIGLTALGEESRRLASAVRDGTIEPAELESGTFTVSNLGMFGIHAVTSIINAPQAAILGVGALRTRLARHEGEIVEETICRLRLCCDHRVLYGADAAQFLARVRELLEQPLSLLTA